MMKRNAESYRRALEERIGPGWRMHEGAWAHLQAQDLIYDADRYEEREMLDQAEKEVRYLYTTVFREPLPIREEAGTMLSLRAGEIVQLAGRAEGRGTATLELTVGTSPLPAPQPLRTDRDVLSCLVALIAAQDTAVSAFRRELLGDVMITPDQVERWLFEHGAEEPGKYERSDTEPEYRLAYAVPGDPGIRKVVVPPDSELARLYDLSERLAAEYRWTPAQATVFLLTDTVPEVRAITLATEIHGRIPALSRVLIVADPALSPAEVAEHYRRERQRIAVEEGAHRRQKDLSPKHRQLALFAATRPSGEPPHKTLERWNRTYPNWAYSGDAAGNFGRDLHAAWRRVLRQPLRRHPHDLKGDSQL